MIRRPLARDSGPLVRPGKDLHLLYLTIKFLHVLGATVILGTGTGIAFFMLMAHLSGEAPFVARTAAVVVRADMIFTASAVLVQPLTGVLLLHIGGFEPDEPWMEAALALYVLAGIVWLPVVWIQIRMRDLAKAAAVAGQDLPPAYHRLFRIWFACGIPGFASVLLIMWLMIAKPSL